MKVKDVKDAILESSNKELKEFVFEHFNNKRSAHDIMNHLQTLKKLNSDILMLGIARMDQIETDYDHSKFLPSLLAMSAIMFTIYAKTLSMGLVLFLATFLFLSLIINLRKGRRIRAVAVYFRSLLIQVNENKKRSNN